MPSFMPSFTPLFIGSFIGSCFNVNFIKSLKGLTKGVPILPIPAG